jgi:ubiquinone/menaquinone biosynthesis C-methylase UbiE
VVIARNVMHHLIGRNMAENRSNQRLALRQLYRVLRPGGLAVIQEHVNQSARSARILYYLSRAASRMKLKIPAYEVTPYTVVSFLTQKELSGMAELEFGATPDAVEFERFPIAWHWRITGLRRVTGNALVVMRKR